MLPAIALIALSVLAIPCEIATAQINNMTKSRLANTRNMHGQSQINSVDTGIKLGGNPYAITVNPESNTVYVVDKFYKKISFIAGDTDKLIRTITIPTSKTASLTNTNITDFSSAITVDSRSNLLYVT